MATHVFARRLLAIAACASIGAFATAAIASPAFAKSKPKSKKHHTTTTTAKKGKKSTKGKSTTTTALGGSSTALGTELKKLETSVKGEKHATFFASYSLKNSGQTQKITFAQEGTESLFGSTSGTIIDNGKATYYCTTTKGTTATNPGTGETCIQSTEADPLAGVLDLFSGTTALEFFGTAQAEAAAKAQGVTIKFSTGTYSGLASKCVTVSGTSKGTYCVANIGILDFWTTTGSTATLTKYSSSVPAGTFTPPAGATITTEPSIPGAGTSSATST